MISNTGRRLHKEYLVKQYNKIIIEIDSHPGEMDVCLELYGKLSELEDKLKNI